MVFKDCFSLSLRRKPLTSKAMKLGGKSKDVDSFVDQLKSEGEHVSNEAPSTARSTLGGNKAASKAPTSAPLVKMERYLLLKL